MHEILRHSNNGWRFTTSQLNIVMPQRKDTHKKASKGREWCTSKSTPQTKGKLCHDAWSFLMVWKWHRTLISFAYQFEEQNDQSPGENKQEVEWDERHYRQWLQIQCFWSKLNCLSDLAIVLTTVNCSPCSCNASSNSCTATTKTNHYLIRVTGA